MNKKIIPLLSFSLLSITNTESAISGELPNIIYILADDLGYGDLSCYGQKQFFTPNIDKLAKDGMLFTSHYSGSTVSAPSRCVLLTGKHTGHCSIRGNLTLDKKRPFLNESDTTIAELLKTKGYQTAAIGKWGLGEAETSAIPNKEGFDYWYGFINQTKAHFQYPDSLWINQKKIALEGNKNGSKNQYANDLFTINAINYIHQTKNNPFFLYLAYTIPHAELTVPSDALKKFEGKYPETAFISPDGHYCSQEKPKATRAAMISRLDSDIGKIIHILDSLNMSSNTIIIFSSDNGPSSEGGADPSFFNSTAQFKGLKRDLYEGGIRVPFIIKWPEKIKASSINHSVVAFQDIVPSIAEICRIKNTKNDGISLYPLFIGKEIQNINNRILYWEFHENGSKQAIRMGKWKGIYYITSNKFELFDINTDPQEEKNIAEQNPSIVEEIKKEMIKQRTENINWPLK